MRTVPSSRACHAWSAARASLPPLQQLTHQLVASQALHALQQLQLRGEPAQPSPQGHLRGLGRRLDLGQEAMVGALGALVAVLRRVSWCQRKHTCLRLLSAQAPAGNGWASHNPLAAEDFQLRCSDNVLLGTHRRESRATAATAAWRAALSSSTGWLTCHCKGAFLVVLWLCVNVEAASSRPHAAAGPSYVKGLLMPEQLILSLAGTFTWTPAP